MPDSWEEELLANARRRAERSSEARDDTDPDPDADSEDADEDEDDENDEDDEDLDDPDDLDEVDGVDEPDEVHELAVSRRRPKPALVDDPELAELKRAGETRVFIHQSAKEEALLERRATATFKRTLGPPDASRAWLSAPRMTRSEVSLRLALFLLKERLVASEVTVALTGDEMSAKKHRPIFPVIDFLVRHQCEKENPENHGWCDRYAVSGAAHALVLCEKADEAPLVAKLSSGARLLVDVMGGPTDPTRSSREHTQLRTAIGRAITLDDVLKADVLAVAMPRSKRFRQLALQWRDAPRLVAAGLRLVWVDRAGNVEGLKGLRGRSRDQ
ncbi:MAG TPA: hypothetical protein VHE78_05065 [Gemmatimonadaceae bacterium]|nr:hypothetical protein [Gemmatimonadaceae bacterium]